MQMINLTLYMNFKYMLINSFIYLNFKHCYFKVPIGRFLIDFITFEGAKIKFLNKVRK